MSHCKNCSSKNIKILQTTPEYNLIKCNNCLFYYKDIGEIDYDTLNENDYSCYNFNRKKEVKELDCVIKKHCKKARISILEIGSGTSAISNELYQLGYNVIGVGPSKIAAQISKNVFPHIKIVNDYFNSNLITHDIDIIIMYDVMEHLEPDNKVFEEVCNFMGKDTLLLLKSGDPLTINAQLFFTRWSYVIIKQHISFYSSNALNVFCKNRNINLISYYKFRHAYGGIAITKILKNLLKFILKTFSVDTLIKRNFQIDLANDHFIAVIKKNAV